MLCNLKIYIHADNDIRLTRKLKWIPKGISQDFTHEEKLNFLFDLMNR